MLTSNQLLTQKDTYATIKVNSSFLIQLDENPFENCAWELSCPPHVRIINTKRYFKESTDTREWEFTISSPGTYLINFYYRKQCCSRRILKTITYTISAN